MRNTFTGQLDEVDSDFRKTGNPPRRKETVVGGTSNKVAEITKTPYRHVPICFVGAYSLEDEIPASPALRLKYPDLPPAIVLDIITKERLCSGPDGYTGWQLGFTPKEHLEQLERRDVRDRQEKQDAKRTSERRWDALILVFVAGGFTILGVLLS